jgi:hypothetical protein
MESRTADLMLRGTSGPLRARVVWPRSAAPGTPLVLLLGGPAHARLLPDAAVVLAPQDADWPDAVEALEWAADHAAELGADPGRLIVAGAGRGAALAARLVRHARDNGWPPVAHRLLIDPHPEEGEMTRFGIVRYIDASPERVLEAWTRELGGERRPVATATLTPVAGATKLHLGASAPAGERDDAEARWSALVDEFAAQLSSE